MRQHIPVMRVATRMTGCALIYIIKILSQAITLVALFTPTCFDPYGSSSGSTSGPC